MACQFESSYRTDFFPTTTSTLLDQLFQVIHGAVYASASRAPHKSLSCCDTQPVSDVDPRIMVSGEERARLQMQVSHVDRRGFGEL